MKEGMVRAALVVGVILRILLWAMIPPTTDSCIHYTTAEYIAETGMFPLFEHAAGTDPFWYPPLFHLSSAVLYKLTGVVTLVPLLAGLMGLVVFAFLVKRFYPDYANYAIVVFALLPFHMYYSGVGYATSLLFLWSAVGIYYYLSYLETGSVRHLGYFTVAAAAAGLTHYHGLALLIAVLVHLGLRDWRRAAAVGIGCLLLVSPWYVRNQIVFGNPVWPLLFEGSIGHPDWNSQRYESRLGSLLNPKVPLTIFLDFWVGAPNSGEDMLDNLETGRRYFGPLADVGFIAWLLAVLSLTSASLYRPGKLKGLKYGGLVLVVFMVSLVPALFNSLARMMVVFIPFTPILVARGVNDVKFKHKDVLLGVALLVLAGGTLSYAFVYRSIVDDYIPFYDMMREEIPEGSRVVMPFTVHECLYYTGLDCVRVREFPNSVPPRVYEDMSILLDYGIDYVCCDRLYWDSKPEEIRGFCNGMPDDRIAFGVGGAGSCWKTSDLFG
ncbi:MAG: hypothetical protein GF414_01190 [Candidatus Altiarchaeales archaeon]|nr:hypothetical protein [Candidatus Altiarchaeales archaeon]